MNKIVQQSIALAFALGREMGTEDSYEIDVYTNAIDAMLGARDQNELQIAILQAAFILYGEEAAHRLQPPTAPAPNPDR